MKNWPEDAARGFEKISREAANCRHCFDQGFAVPAYIDVAQPRWVGDKYWRSARRILIMLINPGGGAYRKDNADEDFRKLLRDFKAGENVLDEIHRHMLKDMGNWGRGRFCRFFISRLHLNLDEIALANIAWCPTAENSVGNKMLDLCFERHTSRLLNLLKPHTVILSGANAHSFEKRIRLHCEKSVLAPHYAHRKGKNFEDGEVARILKELEC